MTYTVRFAPEVTDQLAALHRYIASAASPTVAADYVEALVAHCEGLATFPHRGMMRDDTRPGLRTCSYKKNAVIATSVDDVAPGLQTWWPRIRSLPRSDKDDPLSGSHDA